MKPIKSVMIRMNLCPGDCLMLTSAVRDLKNACPDLGINVETKCPDVWENNPYLDRSITAYKADKLIYAEYDLIHQSNQAPFHFIHGFRMNLAKQLDTVIPAGPFKVDLHFTDEEKETPVRPQLKDKRYWVLNAGHKLDATVKAWEFQRYQEVVDRMKKMITFVQIGKRDKWNVHPSLQNVFDMTDRTTVREVLRLIYHSAGVLTNLSFTALAPTMPGPNTVIRKLRPCVIVAGGREPAHWQQMPGHFYVHRCGILDCNRDGGCWRYRVKPIPEYPKHNSRICAHPTQTPSGQLIPLCMDMISVEEVCRLLHQIETGWTLNDVSMQTK